MQLACTLCAIALALELTRDDALSKRESSLEEACVLAFTGMKFRLTSLQPAFLLTCSLAINAGGDRTLALAPAGASETLASPRKPGAFGCLRTHLFGCICRYSLLVLYYGYSCP